MYIKIRNLAAKPGDADLRLNLGKATKIQYLRSLIAKEWRIKTIKQRLFYKGKLLIDDHTLFDYDVQLNDVIQLMVTEVSKGNQSDDETEQNTKVAVETVETVRKEKKERIEEIGAESSHYKIGEKVDLQDESGAWYEAIIERIVKNPEEPDIKSKESDLIFKCFQDNISYPIRLDCHFEFVRPRSYYVFPIKELSSGMTVLANYNVDAPEERGYWYDFKISKVYYKKRSVKGTLFLGTDATQLKDITIKHVDEIYRIERPRKTAHKTPVDIPPRKLPISCTKCNDKINEGCDKCGCKICHGKMNVELIILCDECDDGFHIGCLDPPLSTIPDENEWYCPNCKVNTAEIINAGERLRISSRKAKKASATNTQGNWGKGMACVGRTKECTITKKDHVGPIPGVEVGTCWLYRQQVSEAGVHRPLVAGIHGSEKQGAYSIVLSGGYEDDVDNGDEFFYTGSGGRDLSGNRRVNEQSCDQQLTRMNKALAMSCNTRFDNVVGSEAEDWKNGKPIRVVRNYKGAKHSIYAPKVGNRYDGIYKVVKYYPETGKSGFVIWRYLLKRDDETPAPWHQGGKEYEVICPDGYMEALEKKKGTKRLRSNDSNGSTRKKIKIEEFTIPADLEICINLDAVNNKLWMESKETLKNGKNQFYEKVQEVFMCICCQKIVHLPITTSCSHNICKMCLERSFESEIYSCPHCRFEFGNDYVAIVNDNLRGALKIMFPQYEDCI